MVFSEQLSGMEEEKTLSNGHKVIVHIIVLQWGCTGRTRTILFGGEKTRGELQKSKARVPKNKVDVGAHNLGHRNRFMDRGKGKQKSLRLLVHCNGGRTDNEMMLKVIVVVLLF